MKNVFFVILAGGNGERLWPLSRRSYPKQLIPFLNNTSLLEQTLDRIDPLVASKDHVVIVTNKNYYNVLERMVGDRVGAIIVEDEARNTAPAILLACHHIAQKDSDAAMIVLPADAYIPDNQAFIKVINDGLSFVDQYDDIVVFGVKPTHAATGYGYVQFDVQQPVGSAGGYRIVQFHEKPDKDRAVSYLQSDAMLWNIGIFAARVQTFFDEFEHHAPAVARAVSRYEQQECSYADIPSISIDYAVMEKSSRIVVFPASFDWYDVGNLHVFLSLQAQNMHDTLPVINVDGAGNMASAKQKLVVCVGVSDLCIVETDDVILVTKKNAAEDIKKVLPHVKKISEASL